MYKYSVSLLLALASVSANAMEKAVNIPTELQQQTIAPLMRQLSFAVQQKNVVAVKQIYNRIHTNVHNFDLVLELTERREEVEDQALKLLAPLIAYYHEQHDKVSLADIAYIFVNTRYNHALQEAMRNLQAQAHSPATSNFALQHTDYSQIATIQALIESARQEALRTRNIQSLLDLQEHRLIKNTDFAPHLASAIEELLQQLSAPQAPASILLVPSRPPVSTAPVKPVVQAAPSVQAINNTTILLSVRTFCNRYPRILLTLGACGVTLTGLYCWLRKR